MTLTVPPISGALAHDDAETLVGVLAPTGGTPPYTIIAISVDFDIAGGAAEGISGGAASAERSRSAGGGASGASAGEGAVARRRGLGGIAGALSAASATPARMMGAASSLAALSAAWAEPVRRLALKAAAGAISYFRGWILVGAPEADAVTSFEFEAVETTVSFQAELIVDGMEGRPMWTIYEGDSFRLRLTTLGVDGSPVAPDAMTVIAYTGARNPVEATLPGVLTSTLDAVFETGALEPGLWEIEVVRDLGEMRRTERHDLLVKRGNLNVADPPAWGGAAFSDGAYGMETFHYWPKEADFGARSSIAATEADGGGRHQPFVIKKGDTSPGLLRYLLNENRAPVVLDGSTLRFRMVPTWDGAPDDLVVEGFAVVNPGAGHLAEYPWQVGDTDVAGDYAGEFVVTFPSGQVSRFPNLGYIAVKIADTTG